VLIFSKREKEKKENSEDCKVKRGREVDGCINRPNLDRVGHFRERSTLNMCNSVRFLLNASAST